MPAIPENDRFRRRATAEPSEAAPPRRRPCDALPAGLQPVRDSRASHARRPHRKTAFRPHSQIRHTKLAAVYIGMIAIDHHPVDEGASMNNERPDVRAKGSCLCGGVRYEVRGPLRDVIACHCSQCRRTTGHYMAATAAKRAHFTVTRDDGLRWY